MGIKSYNLKKYKLIMLLCFLYLTSYAQLIKGKVYDEKTKSTIPFASVYFNGTFIGTYTDKDGHFEMENPKNISMPLTISAIGYYSVTMAHFATVESLNIYLKPKEYELGEATVKTKSLVRKRKRYLAFFKEEFLGTSTNARDCSILNEEDISYNYATDQDTLKAFASRPILIENKALGYTITYYLDKFEYYKKTQATFFIGNIIFKENISTADKKKQFDERRKYSYSYSSMQFFRALWSDLLKENSITITGLSGKNLRYKDVVALDSKNNKYLNSSGNLTVGFSESYYSTVNFLKNYVYFDKTGYFDPSGINWTGDIAKKRVADWLPYEYTIEK